MLVILDSTVLIDALRGKPGTTQHIRSLLTRGETVGTTSINVEEIVRGLRPAEQPAADMLLDGLAVVPIAESTARAAGLWRREYASRGITLGQADCLVAAAAQEHDALLCTGNPKDFPMLDVEHWPVGR